MQQESVYTKLALNGGTAQLIKNKVRLHAPKDGIIEMLTITEKQFSSIEFVCGDRKEKIVDNEERLIVI